MCWLLSSEEIWSTSDFSFSQVTSVEKREPRKHFSASACSFLGLGLRPRPQKSGFGFEKLFLGSLFSTSVTWEKLKSDVDKFFLRVASTIFKTKYYFYSAQMDKSWQRNFSTFHRAHTTYKKSSGAESIIITENIHAPVKSQSKHIFLTALLCC